MDWAGGNIFWSDPRRKVVEVARLDGSHRYVLFNTEPLAITSKCTNKVYIYREE